MAKLVVLNAGMTGRSYELKDKTTIGRVEDNTFQIAEPSVSSHHCEVFLQGDNFVVKDLNSTNGTFINNDKILESVLKPGQTLRLGQVEIRLETDATAGATATSAPAPAPSPAPPPAPAGAPAAPAPGSRKQDHSARGVSLNELEQGPRGGFDTASRGFSKKSNKANRWFLIVGIIVMAVIGLIILIAISNAR